MTSLWRNDILLGEIVDPPGKQKVEPGAIQGLLQPTPAFTGIEPMWQLPLPFLPGGPIRQRVVERRILGPHQTKPTNRTPIRSFVVPETPMSQEHERGVPADKLLEIRDDQGNPLDYDHISLRCYVVPADAPLAQIEKHWGKVDATREKWLVHARRSRVGEQV